MHDEISLFIPELNITLEPGTEVRLNRFDTVVWIVHYGWYSVNGNRAICGWYLSDICNPTRIRSLQKPDLDDIYLIES